MQEEPKRSLLPLVHTLIGLTIMFSGHFLPCPAMVVETSDKLAGGGGSPHKARLSLLDQHLRDLLTDAYQIYTRS